MVKAKGEGNASPLHGGGSEARLADRVRSGLVPDEGIIKPRLNDAPS